MDFKILELILLATALFWVAWAALVRWHQPWLLPPGPRRWPVVGNILHLCGEPPHLAITKLVRDHGPIMTLWLGSICTVVISSPEVAREMFKNHDAALAGRKVYEAVKGRYGFEGSIITSQYNSQWRMLRRLCTTELFVSRRLDAMIGVRRKCVDQLVKLIQEASGFGTNAIDLGHFFSLLTFNLMGNLMFSMDLLDPNSERISKFFYHARQVIELSGKPNVADFVPIFRRLDPQGINRRTQFHIDCALQIMKEFVKERMGRMENGDSERKINKRNDYFEVLLEFEGHGIEEPTRLSSQTIHNIFFEMFAAGTDTTTGTLEWAMAELLRNPTILNKLQAELRNNISPGNKLEEKDFENLPYLDSVIKETLRLHPPLPFLVPHMASKCCNMFGYTIPKETQIFVNVWAIGRDPNSWDDPLVFKPERFLEHDKMDYKGQHFEFIPFGSGRRMCPAVSLASRVLPLTLGSLLLSFDWKLAEGLRPEDMDMSERMAVTLRKSAPLKVIPLPYHSSY